MKIQEVLTRNYRDWSLIVGQNADMKSHLALNLMAERSQICRVNFHTLLRHVISHARNPKVTVHSFTIRRINNYEKEEDAT